MKGGELVEFEIRSLFTDLKKDTVESPFIHFSDRDLNI